MNPSVKYAIVMLFCFSGATPPRAFSKNINEAVEPMVQGSKVIDLLRGDTLAAWEIPSDHWSLKEGSMVGDTGSKALNTPEWIYTQQQFSDFEFTCEMKLTGDESRNTGVYFRANTMIWKDRKGKKSYEAASGYEFDAAYHNPKKKRNYRGTLGGLVCTPIFTCVPGPKGYQSDL